MATAVAGPEQILEAWALPNPNPRLLDVRLAGPADSIRCRIYTTAMVCVASQDLPGGWQAGWNKVPLPAGFSAGLADGLYYLALDSLKDGQERNDPSPLLFYILK